MKIFKSLWRVAQYHRLKAFVATLLCVCLLLPSGISATTYGSVYIDGLLCETLDYTVVNGTSMVAVSDFVQALSLNALWSDSSVTISSENDIEVKLCIDSEIAVINDNNCYLPEKPFSKKEKMFVPMRFVAETFGYVVNYEKNNGNIYIAKKEDDAMIINPMIVTFVQGGITANRHMGQSDITLVKYTADNKDPGTDRNTYYRFDVKNINPESIETVLLRVYCTSTQGENMNVIEVFETDDEWTLETLSFNNKPELNEKIDETVVYVPLKWYEFDVTDYIKKEATGDGIASIVLTDTYGFSSKSIFSGYQNANAPHLAVYDKKVEKHYVVDDVDMRVNLEMDGEKDIVLAKRYPASPYRPFLTQTVEKLDGFEMNQEIQLDSYGGWITDKVKCSKKTGFFFTEKIDGRWWIVTPDGNPYISVGINCVRGTGSEWADNVSELLKEYGFNSQGGWSDKMTKSDGTGFPYVYIFDNLTVGYTSQLNSKSGKSYTLPVFDSDFREYVAESVKKKMTEARINDKYLIGYLSDNERPVDYDLLDKYLALDPNDPYAKESLNAVWNWLRERHGEDVTVEDITWRDMDDFRGYVFETYYRIVREEIEKADPNHMYLGSRYHVSETMYSPALMKAAASQLDAITYNVYHFWTVDDAPLKNLETKYGDKPIIVTEFYTKGEDTGMENKDGAGYVVKTQKDRGMFYQNYALSLLNSKNCVGWHWFLYDDGEGKGSNKGIKTETGELHKEALNEMKKLNDNVYQLIDFIDRGGK